MPVGNDAPFIDASGNPLSSGLLYFYIAGSSTLSDTYTTSAGGTLNANPVVLGTGGYPSSGGNVVQIWGTDGVSYKAVLKTSAGVTVWTRDNLELINDSSITLDQWVTGATPAYVSGTSFTLVGDVTSTYNVGRRIKTTNTGGTIYSTISISAYTTLTTVTVVNDSSTLDSGLSAVSYGVLSASNPSTPLITDAYPIVSGSADKTKKLRFEVDGFTTATTRVVTIPDRNITIDDVTRTGFTTGDVKLTLKTTADTGWVMCNDGTIGNAASGGTTRANADTVDLFTLLWNNVADAQAAVSGGRGANAAADYAADKTIALTKMLGRAFGSAGAGSGLTSRALGLTTGVETHPLVTGELAAHTHIVSDSSGTGAATYASVAAAASDTTRSSSSTGSGTAHQNMQPTAFVNAMIKL